LWSGNHEPLNRHATGVLLSLVLQLLLLLLLLLLLPPLNVGLLSDLTSCSLSRCTLENNPLPLLASLPSLRHLHLSATHVSTAVDGLSEWLVFPAAPPPSSAAAAGASAAGRLPASQLSLFRGPAARQRLAQQGRVTWDLGQLTGGAPELGGRGLHHSLSSPVAGQAAAGGGVGEGSAHGSSSSSNLSSRGSPPRGQPHRSDSAPGISAPSSPGAPGSSSSSRRRPSSDMSSSSRLAGASSPSPSQGQPSVDQDGVDHTPGLRGLSLCDMGLQQLPPSVCHISRLTRLELRGNSELGSGTGHAAVALGSSPRAAVGGLPNQLAQLHWLQVGA
jgi:hypothetical protein